MAKNTYIEHLRSLSLNYGKYSYGNTKHLTQLLNGKKNLFFVLKNSNFFINHVRYYYSSIKEGSNRASLRYFYLLFYFFVYSIKNSYRRSVIAPSKNFLVIILTRYYITNRSNIDYGKHKISKNSSKVFLFDRSITLFNFFDCVIHSLKLFVTKGIYQVDTREHILIKFLKRKNFYVPVFACNLYGCGISNSIIFEGASK